MGRYHNLTFPNESSNYRVARDALLGEEMELRRQTEKVAALRRALPLGGAVKEDYVFQNLSGGDTQLSELFSDKCPNLLIYGFMYEPGAEACPICTSFMDSVSGGVLHMAQYFNFAVIVKAAVEELKPHAEKRNWSNLTLLSSGKTTFNLDYKAEDDEGRQGMMLNAFRKTDDGIFHTWAFELFSALKDRDRDPRHPDRIAPLWSIFDVTLDGRPSDWFPAYSYE